MPRSACFGRVFEPLGMKQIEEFNCVEQGLKLPGGFHARVFGLLRERGA